MQFKPLIILKINIDYSLFKYFADLVSLRSILIASNNLGNIADGKLFTFLLKPVLIYMICFYSVQLET